MITDTWKKDKILSIAQEACRQIDSLQILSSNKPKVIVRFPLSPTNSVIVKFWTHPYIKYKIKKLMGMTSACNEWKMLNHFRDLGIKAPVPYGMCYLPLQYKPFSEAVIIEDLGDCINLLHHLVLLIQKGNEEELSIVEENLIQMTTTMIQNNVLDSDHGLINLKNAVSATFS